MDEEVEVRVKATVVRKEYYEIEIVVPDYYSYEDIEDEVREKFYDLCVADGVSPVHEEEEVWDVDETPIVEPVDEQDT